MKPAPRAIDEALEVDRPGAEQEYRVALPAFEGPLDLLLHLIQKHELDVLDIPIGFITEKYLEYLELMRDLTIDVASEYLVMAATLAHIKSKQLLPEEPKDQEDGDELEELDPREELVRRLLEYQKYKGAAEELDSRGALGRDVFLRGTPAPEAEGPAPLADVGVFKLLDAFARVLGKTKAQVEHEISFDRMSVTERIQQITDVLGSRRRCSFEELFQGAKSRFELILTFLALLEMCKLRMTRIYQADPLADIHVELAATEPMGEIVTTVDDPSADAAPDSEPEPNSASDSAPAPVPDSAPASDPAPAPDPEEPA